MRSDIEEIRKDRTELKKQMTDYSKRVDNLQETLNGKIHEYANEMREMQQNLYDALAEMKQDSISNEIDNIRWTIIDFSNSIRSGRTYDLEAYNHIVELDSRYEKILEKNHMENGRVTMAMKLVNEKYETGLREGFPI